MWERIFLFIIKCGGKRKRNQRETINIRTICQKKSSSWFQNVSNRKKPKKSEVVINIGIMGWHESSGSIKPIRGKRICLRIDANAKYEDILVNGEKRIRDFYSDIVVDELYDLVFESGEMALVIPGTDEEFTLSKYKAELGKEYKNITLYIISESDKAILDKIKNNPFDEEFNPDMFLDSLESPLKKSKCKSPQPGTSNDNQQQDDLFSVDLKDLFCDQISHSESPIIEHNYADVGKIPEVVVRIVSIDEDGAEIKDAFLHRSKIRQDVLQLFDTNDVFNVHLNIKVVAENGQVEDGVGIGVIRDVISAFFDDFYLSCCVGSSTMKVPALRHDLQACEWEAVARVIALSTAYGYFPTKLSPVFMKNALFSLKDFSEEELLESFFSYVSAEEKQIFEKFMNTFDEQLEEDFNDLLEALSSYNCYSNPSKDKIKAILIELAMTQLIQKPQFVSNCFFGIFRQLKMPDAFNDIQRFQKIYSTCQLTSKKVIKSIVPPEIMSDHERSCFGHLKRFIKGLDTTDLGKFSRFVTGSDVYMDTVITLEFTLLDGFERRPIAKTCGPILQLPSTYSCYSELAEELGNILKDKLAWRFTAC